MKPPCKKCLKYAVCISQNQLSCDELQNFFNDIHQSIKKRYAAIATLTEALDLLFSSDKS